MKRDEKNETPKKSVRKINIDDLPKRPVKKNTGSDEGDAMGETKVFRDLPLNDGEDFEFQPDFDTMDFFDEDILQEPPRRTASASRRSIPVEEGDMPEERPVRRTRRRRLESERVPEETEEEIPEKRRIKKLKLTPEELEERKAVRKKRRSQNPDLCVCLSLRADDWLFCLFQRLCQ